MLSKLNLCYFMLSERKWKKGEIILIKGAVQVKDIRES